MLACMLIAAPDVYDEKTRPRLLRVGGGDLWETKPLAAGMRVPAAEHII